MKRIRVLILTEGLSIGGQQKYTLRQIQHSDRERYRFFIGYPTEGPLIDEYASLGVELFRYPNMSNFYRQVFHEKIPVLNPFCIILPLIRIRNFILQNKIQLIQTNDILTYILGTTVSRFTKVPAIRIQGNIMKDIEWCHYKLFQYLPFSRWTSKYVLLIEEQRKDFIDLGVPEEKLCLIDSYGVDLNEFHPAVSNNKVRDELGIDKNTLVIGQAGRLVKSKRFDFMLKSAPIVLEECPECIFLIAGDGPERNYLEKLSFELGIAENVIFSGFRLDMPEVTSAFDIALFTMADQPGGTANWEALACGKPVVCTNNSIIEHGKTGYVVPSNDRQSFADSIIRLILNPDLRIQMGKHARYVSEEKYDFVKKFIPKIQNLYDSVISGNN